MLTAEQRAQIRSRIEELIAELEGELAHQRESLESIAPDSAIGRLSRMDSMVNRGTLEMAMTESTKRLSRLRHRLDEVDEPDYGKCNLCGEWIPMERLLVAPERRVCVPCLNKQK